ncbi:MAG: hypothetical protein RIS94_2203 [Pseudomonadota bacterium]|jgi:hypothetical protein
MVRLDLQSMRLASRRATRRTLLVPDLIEAALARLGDRRFTPEEQAIILRAVSDPSVVQWPDWWEVRGRGKKGET